MANQDKIPSSKVARATRFVSTGAKVGGNYIKHYVKKAFDATLDQSELNKANAEDIYETLSELKGSALKMAQMLAMDRTLLPSEYTDQFAQAQYKAPPLSGPLIAKTFRKSFGKNPSEIFDSFETEAANAASIGQVHKAVLNGKNLAVKIQYPGVADSIVSDLRLIKPFALRIMKMKASEVQPYFEEVQSKLLEEADYKLELDHSMYIAEKCRHMEGLVFPEYFPELSSDRVITMSWLPGIPLAEYLKQPHPQEDRNKIGQLLWNFYMFQTHTLRMLHADPHPGNFFVTENLEVGVIDFGCIKIIPEAFYYDYFSMMETQNFHDATAMQQSLIRMEILTGKETEAETRFFVETFQHVLSYLRKPFEAEYFDFGDDSIMQELHTKGEEISKSPEAKKYSSARGSKHILYVNRTLFGLFSVLALLKANIKTEGALFIPRRSAEES